MNGYIEEYININGVEHYFLHYPVSSDIVVLFLHGGPGQSELFFTHATRPKNPIFNFVYYDQRGTGKTWLKNKTSKATLELLIEDLNSVIKYIKDKYSTDKIILLGHSWGSVLGTEYIKRFSNDVVAFVGMGQVVNMLEGELIAYKKLGELISKGADSSHKSKYNRLKGYPYNIDKHNPIKSIMGFRKLQGKYGIGPVADFWKFAKIVLKSPLFSIKDFYPLINGINYNKGLLDYLLEYDTSNYTEYPLPVFYICGDSDWQVPSVLAAKYFEKIVSPKKDILWIKNAGHFPDIDNSTEYNNAIVKIIKKLKL